MERCGFARHLELALLEHHVGVGVRCDGQVGLAQEAPAAQLPGSASEVEKLSWRDLQQFAATFCLDDLAAVHRRGGEALLRERVAALSAGERAVLREALAEPISA